MYITGGDSHVANKTTERKKEVSQSELASSNGKELTEEEMQKVIDFAEMVVKARDK